MSIPLFLFILLFLISPYNLELTINNPYKSNKIYNLIDYKIIILSENIIISSRDPTGSVSQSTSSYTVLQHYNKLYHNLYALSPNFFGFIDNSNTTYVKMENKLFKMIKEDNDTDPFIFSISYSSFDFIKGNIQYESMNKDGKKIIYGQHDKTVNFYNLDTKNSMTSNLNGIDRYISCKLFSNESIICIYLQNNQIKLSTFYEIDRQMIIHDTYVFNSGFLSEIDKPILYDTNKTNFKVVCGREKGKGYIKCNLIELTFF